MATFTVTVTDSGVAARLQQMVAAQTSLQPLYAAIGGSLLSNVQLGFKFGRSPWGDAWRKPLLRNGQPLRDTGRLNRSITVDATGDGVTVGTNVLYAPVHQFGATIRAKNKPFLVFRGGPNTFFRKKQVVVPARPFLPIRPGGQVDLPASWQKSIVSRIRAHVMADGGGI